MDEIFEFRVSEEFANRLFNDDEGKKLGSGLVRLVRLSSGDPRISQVGKLEEQIHRECDESFFYGWRIERNYSRLEIDAADAFKLEIRHTFEPAGEECGTVYDESTACPLCGAGATQVSPLRLDLRKVPKNTDLACTIAGEIIVSQRLAELLTDGAFTGFELERVRHKARYEDDPVDLQLVASGREILEKAAAAGVPFPSWGFWVWLNRPENRILHERALREYVDSASAVRGSEARNRSPAWYQVIVATGLEIVAPTRVGIGPFDEDVKGQCRCPQGDTIGLNLLSELWVSRKEFEEGNCDMAVTRQRIGVRRGLLRPEAQLVISRRLRNALTKSDIKGFRVEIAHLK